MDDGVTTQTQESNGSQVEPSDGNREAFVRELWQLSKLTEAVGVELRSLRSEVAEAQRELRATSETMKAIGLHMAWLAKEAGIRQKNAKPRLPTDDELNVIAKKLSRNLSSALRAEVERLPKRSAKSPAKQHQ